MFRLFNGPFVDNLIGDDDTQKVTSLITKLTKFYSKVRISLFHCENHRKIQRAISKNMNECVDKRRTSFFLLAEDISTETC